MQTKLYQEKLEQMIKEYLENNKSLTEISKQYNADRGSLANNLRARGYDVINYQNLPRVKSDLFSAIDSEEKAYWLGFLYADGCVSSTDNRVELTLQEGDYHHLEKFQAFIRHDINHYPKIEYRKKQRAYRVMFRNKQMKEDLIRLGCVPNKSLILKFPNSTQVPDKLIFHFCRGYVDGDGYLGLKTGKIPRLSILGTEDFIEGFIDRTQFKVLKVRKVSNIYTVEWSAYYVSTYLCKLYQNANIYLDRKYKIALPFIEETL